MKKNVQTSAMMTVLLTLLIVSSMMYAIPVIAQTEESFDPRGTWTLTIYPNGGEPFTHIMIIGNYSELDGTFAGIGRDSNDPTATSIISGTLFLDTENTVQLTVKYSDTAIPFLDEAPGYVLPEISKDKPMTMWDSENVNPEWIAIKRTEDLVFNPIEGDPTRIQVTFSNDTAIGDVEAYENNDDLPPIRDNGVLVGVGDRYNINLVAPDAQELNLGLDLITLCIRIEQDQVPIGVNPCQLFMVQYTLLGDVDDNGIVHPRDASRIIKAIGTRPGDKKWNRNCDLNNDRKITFDDLNICLFNMGETEPEWVPIPSIVHIIDATGNGPTSDDYIVVCGFPDHFSGWGIRR